MNLCAIFSSFCLWHSLAACSAHLLPFRVPRKRALDRSRSLSLNLRSVEAITIEAKWSEANTFHANNLTCSLWGNARHETLKETQNSTYIHFPILPLRTHVTTYRVCSIASLGRSGVRASGKRPNGPTKPKINLEPCNSKPKSIQHQL